MNDEFQITDEQLRSATSRALPADATLDPEAAAAREAFVAFGSAVESAAGESAAGKFDEAALIDRIVADCSVESQELSVPAQRQRNWWPLIASGAIAAGMLLAIAQIGRERQQRVDGGSGGSQVIVKAAPDKAVPLRATASPLWSDPLDDEIALAAVTIEQFSSANHRFDSSLLDMNDRLEALSRELSGETL